MGRIAVKEQHQDGARVQKQDTSKFPSITLAEFMIAVAGWGIEPSDGSARSDSAKKRKARRDRAGVMEQRR